MLLSTSTWPARKKLKILSKEKKPSENLCPITCQNRNVCAASMIMQGLSPKYLANVRYYYFGLAGTLQKNYFNFATLTKYNYKFIYVLFLRSVLVRTRARTDFSCYSHTNKKTRHHVTRYSIFNWTTFLSNVHVTVLPSEQNSGQTKNKFSFGHDQRSQL